MLYDREIEVKCNKKSEEISFPTTDTSTQLNFQPRTNSQIVGNV